MVRTATLDLATDGNGQVIDITEALQGVLFGTQLQHGIATVFCPSATSAVTTMEFESGVVRDLQRLFDEIVPPDGNYLHNQRTGDDNGHSHVRAALLGPSLTVPFSDRRLTLGTWQRVVYVDFDVRPRQRRLVVQIMGD
ncbi:MAG: secondary thiamine-phosphate synthase enzyme YjbQ [Anaerolineae bacterium]|nr:secondary thiamine-phosphate synthase enzyme YjbQ [Anaerolineae bacterium]